MTDVELSTTARFFAAHTELRRKMAASSAFPRVKQANLLEIDGEELYIVKGDALGDEEELYVEAVIRGAAGQDELNREVFAELDDEERELILREFRKL